MSESQATLPTETPEGDIPRSDAVVTAQDGKEDVTTEPVTESQNKVTPKENVLAKLTPDIIDALTFDNSTEVVESLRDKNKQLQGLLRKVIELLKDKSQMCGQVEKQNLALTVQVNALKDVVGITKDLLSIRNMEVQHLQTDINKMEEKINAERQRHNAMLERMSAAAKLNQNLKNEYQTQLGLFQDLRGKYDEKVTILTNENKRLQGLNNESSSSVAVEGEEDITLSLETLPPR